MKVAIYPLFKKQVYLAFVIINVILHYSPKAIAQSVISGKVTNNNNETIKGANVGILNSYDGATTDTNGFYKFSTTDTGLIILQVDADGYKLSGIEFQLSPNSIIQKDIILREKFNQLSAVTVTAGVLDQKKISVLNSIDMVTVAGSSGDVASALKTLPGTQQASDREGLFVRGGTGSETQQFIDGLLVRNAFLTAVPGLGTRGRFSPFLFKGTVFSTGGYSAMYSQALSAVVNLESIDFPDKTTAFLNLSSIGIGGGYQSINKKQNFSIGGSYNYTNLAPYFLIVKQNVDYFKAPVYHNADINFRLKTSQYGILKFYSSGSLGILGLRRGLIDSYVPSYDKMMLKNEFQLNNNNSMNMLSWSDKLKNNWKIRAGIGYSFNKDVFKNGIVDLQNQPINDSIYQMGNIKIDNSNSLFQSRIALEKLIKGMHVWRVGSEYMRATDQTTLGDSATYKLLDHYQALFSEADIYLNNNFGGKIGLRLEQNSAVLSQQNYLEKWRLSPRASLAYRLKKIGEISAAVGLYYQKPEPRQLQIAPNLNYQSAIHYILNYTRSSPGRLLRLEGYYKDYNDLVKTQSNLGNALFNQPFLQPTSANNNGYGHAAGGELYFRDKKSIKGIDYWVSYSYTDAKRNFLYYPIATQPDFVAKHNLSLVVKKFWESKFFGINATYSYASGRPYFNPNVYYTNHGIPIEQNFMTDRTYDFHNFSLSANYIRKFLGAFTVFVVSINNAANFKQVYGYNYSNYAKDQNGLYYRQEIKPTAPMFVFLGMFMSFGIDRTQEAIDNNL